MNTLTFNGVIGGMSVKKPADGRKTKPTPGRKKIRTRRPDKKKARRLARRSRALNRREK